MRRGKRPREKSEFDQVLVDVARVARIVAGGRRFRFRATVVIGNKKGKVGMGISKGTDVTNAVNKAVDQAKKNLIIVPIVDGTIPHQIEVKFRGAHVFLKPARKGTGIIAGGAVRAVVEMAGIQNILSKMMGSNNKPNNVQATLHALAQLSSLQDIEERRGMKIESAKKDQPKQPDPTKKNLTKEAKPVNKK